MSGRLWSLRPRRGAPALQTSAQRSGHRQPLHRPRPDRAAPPATNRSLRHRRELRQQPSRLRLIAVERQAAPPTPARIRCCRRAACDHVRRASPPVTCSAHIARSRRVASACVVAISSVARGPLGRFFRPRRAPAESPRVPHVPVVLFQHQFGQFAIAQLFQIDRLRLRRRRSSLCRSRPLVRSWPSAFVWWHAFMSYQSMM